MVSFLYRKPSGSSKSIILIMKKSSFHLDKDRKRNIIYKRDLQKRKENAMKIQDKLDLWVKLTNVDPTKEQKSYTVNMSGRLSDFDIKQMNDKIKEALKYDATGILQTLICLSISRSS